MGHCVIKCYQKRREGIHKTETKMYTVKLWIQNGQGDLEEQEITSDKSLRAAKNKTTRWINRHYFESDIQSLEKGFETRRRADWTLMLNSPWAGM